MNREADHLLTVSWPWGSERWSTAFGERLALYTPLSSLLKPSQIPLGSHQLSEAQASSHLGEASGPQV